MPPEVHALDATQLHAWIGIIAALGTIAIWLLSKTFVTRRTLVRVHTRIDALEKEVTTCQQQIALAVQPMTQLVAEIREFKNELKGLSEILREYVQENERRLALHGERLAKLEGRSERESD